MNPLSTDQIAKSCWLSAEAKALLLTAPRSEKGAGIQAPDSPVAIRELFPDGLVNRQGELTELGACKHAQLVEEATR